MISCLAFFAFSMVKTSFDVTLKVVVSIITRFNGQNFRTNFQNNVEYDICTLVINCFQTLCLSWIQCCLYVFYSNLKWLSLVPYNLTRWEKIPKCLLHKAYKNDVSYVTRSGCLLESTISLATIGQQSLWGPIWSFYKCISKLPWGYRL